ncbi:hypothetical protein AVEN_263578-1 [Araneus ventricosus]|uniref:Uncharacterized protein n=1 Tax=Araneus ventricosus TaxID=182803 RepID=A0A4Y2HU31_ARAVE|nr:hypothetical protein AVEN_263578-1 [Araneus ventricosus]
MAGRHFASFFPSPSAGLIPNSAFLPFFHSFVRQGAGRLVLTNNTSPKLEMGYSLYSIRIYTKIVDLHQILDRILQLEAFRLLIHVHVNMETPKINDLDGLNLPNDFITRIAALYKIMFKLFQ